MPAGLSSFSTVAGHPGTCKAWLEGEPPQPSPVWRGCPKNQDRVDWGDPLSEGRQKVKQTHFVPIVSIWSSWFGRVASEKQANAQMFGQRSLGSGRSASRTTADTSSVGTVQGSERFVRGNRSRATSSAAPHGIASSAQSRARGWPRAIRGVELADRTCTGCEPQRSVFFPQPRRNVRAATGRGFPLFARRGPEAQLGDSASAGSVGLDSLDRSGRGVRGRADGHAAG